VTPEPPRLDPELYRAQLMAAEEEALGLFLTAVIDDRSVEDAGVPATPPGLAGAQGTQAAAAPEAGTDLRDRAAPPEASGDRLVGAAVEALEASQPQPPAEMPAAEPAERVVRPGSRVVPSVTTPVPVFGTTVRGGETAWRLAEWSGESLEAFRARNRLGPDQSLPAGRPVSISTAVVSREAFEARRAAFHEALRDKAAREFTVTGTRPHRLEPGQTPWRVAETNRVPFWLLEQTNPDRDLSALKAGDTLLVPIIKK
jgi:hypothetical protein